MTRLCAAAFGLFALCAAGSAAAQAPAPAASPQTVAMTDDRAAKIEKMVTGACGRMPAAKAVQADKDHYAQCIEVAKSRAAAMIP